MSTLSVNNVTEVGGAPVVTNGVLDSGSLPTGTILQVVQAVKTDTFSTTSQTYTTVTGLSVSITPSSASSKFLLLATINASMTDTDQHVSFFRFAGGNSTNFVGDTAGSRVPAFGGIRNVDGGSSLQLREAWNMREISASYLDSPATASPITYTIETRAGSAAPANGTVYVNRGGLDNDTGNYARGASSLIVMEVAG